MRFRITHFTSVIITLVLLISSLGVFTFAETGHAMADVQSETIIVHDSEDLDCNILHYQPVDRNCTKHCIANTVEKDQQASIFSSSFSAPAIHLPPQIDIPYCDTSHDVKPTEVFTKPDQIYLSAIVKIE